MHRRDFLSGVAAAAGATLLNPGLAGAAEGPLETTSVKLIKSPALCTAPQFIAEELLRAEGFSDIRFVESTAPEIPADVAAGKLDFSMAYASQFVASIDQGLPLTLLGGIMVGCFELFGSERVRTIAELKGKSVGIEGLGSPHAAFVAIMAAHVGLDPAKDIRWVIPTDPSVKPLDLFAEGKVDAFLGFPPEPQYLRARHIGHVLISTGSDRPWSQY